MRRRLEFGETGDFPVLEELHAGRPDRLFRHGAAVRQGGGHRRDGLLHVALDDDAAGRFFTTPIWRRFAGWSPCSAWPSSRRRWPASPNRWSRPISGGMPGRRVLQGRMSRGAVERMNAVIWFSDMQGYTALSERIASDQIIPLLNDYAEVAIMAIHGAGGDVLKLMADGVLAIFTADDPAEACMAALRAEADMRLKLANVNERRSAAGQPVSSIYLGLHIGDVFYGNIGSKDRLDFTVVGQAVNEASRIASMCRSADRDVLFSSAFRESLPEGRPVEAGLGRALCPARRRPRAGTVHARPGDCSPACRCSAALTASRRSLFSDSQRVGDELSASACPAPRRRARPRRRASGTSAASCPGRRREACRSR